MFKKNIALIIIIFFVYNEKVISWVYPEHRNITILAVKKLEPKYRQILDQLWTKARRENQERLTLDIIDPYQFRNPTHIDFGAWPAISGDHSCSARNMLDVVLNSDWILKVADIAAKLDIDLKKYGTKNERITENALRDADILLQNADVEYATRAGSNNVHFLLPLKNPDVKLHDYLNRCIAEGTDVNAISTYAWYHLNALIKISNVNNDSLTEKEQSKLILSALADEAYALHFLGDIFAAGHVAGTWGNTAQRKGTHDYYNEHGIKTSTWEGNKIILTGDAYMRNEDANRAAEVLKISLEQFIFASNGNIEGSSKTDNYNLFMPDSFNVCNNNYVLARDYTSNHLLLLEEVIKKTPVPGLESGIGELPRFHAELGFFTGISPSIHGSFISGGFGENQETIGLIGGIEASIRFGVGLDGVLNEAGDGLIYLGLGWREDGSSTTGIIDEAGIEKYGSLLSAIPGRSAYSARLRLPFYIVPGDLLLLGPLLYFTSPNAIKNMAVVAANGGILRWHSGIATSLGRFQFVLGREMAVYIYGRNKARDALFLIENDFQTFLVSYRSTQLEFPILEYQPTRSFATNQSSTLLFQIFGGIDFPHNIGVLDTTDENIKPNMENVWFWGLRIVFDWRHYF
jgi:hypothetical protein